MKEQMIDWILERVDRDAGVLSDDFNMSKGVSTRFTAIDSLFPKDVATRLFEAFPDPTQMRLMDSFRERKYTSKSLDRFPDLLSDATFAFQDGRVIDAVSRITGHRDAVGDPFLYAGGISAMAKGHFLNPHIDNSHDYEQKNYRVLNLLYYCTPDWKPEYGGNLELWDEGVRTPFEIPSLFNRLVLMETNARSWHSVNKVKVDGIRCCISNYYFSPHSPNGHETSHVTVFHGRPEEKLKRVVSAADGIVRNAARKVFSRGLSKKDLFEKPKP